MVIGDYHLEGEGSATKNKMEKCKVSSQPSSAQFPADNYDDIILPNRDVTRQESGPKGYGKPPAPPPTENYSVVTKGAKVVVQEKHPMEYNCLHQHAVSTSAQRKLEGYSKLTDVR